MKKVLAFLLICAFLLSLAACGTTSPAVTDEPEKTEAPAVTEAPDDPGATADTDEPEAPTGVTLPLVEETAEFDIWTKNFRCFSYYDGFNDSLWWQELENRTNVHINWYEWNGTGNSNEAFMLLVGSGEWESYDALVDVGSLYTGGDSAAYGDEIIMDLAPYLEEYAPDYYNLVQNDDTYKLNTYKSTGEMLAMYQCWDYDKLPSLGLTIRYDWLEQVNMEVPKTYTQLHDALTAFKTELGADAALWINSDVCNVGGMLSAGYDVDSFYGPTEGLFLFFQVDGVVKYSPIEEGYREYIQMLHDWYAEGLIYSDFMAYTEPMLPDMALLSNGRTGVLNGMVDMLPMFEMNTDGGVWGGLYNPVKTDGQQTHFAFKPDYVPSGQGLYLTTTCSNPELLIQWANYLYSDEGSFFKRYGIEGESFDYIDGEPVLNKANIYEREEFGGFSEAGVVMYLGGDCWGLDSTYPRLTTYTEMQQTCLTAWSYNNDADYNMPSGATMTPDESSEWSNIFDDISTYVSENVGAFVVGDKDMADWDKFVDQIKELNIDRCIELEQNALDRFYGVA